MEIAIRKIMPADIDRVIAQFIAQGDNKPREFWEKYLREHENGDDLLLYMSKKLRCLDQ